MSSLESPHQGDSNEYTQYTIFCIKKKITLNYPYLQLWNFSKGLNNEFETAMVNEPSVFEPLKFYCDLVSKWDTDNEYPKCSIKITILCFNAVMRLKER